jgi:uncharacterized protein (DUF1015 family)
MPAAAKDVAAVPYDVVTTGEAAALAHGNPLSFLHVSRAEIDLPSGTDPYADRVYETARQNLRRLKIVAPLVIEDEPALYVYQLRMDPHVQTGVAGCFSLDEYERDAIKKHEHTRREKEDDRTRHMLAVEAQTGPVLLTYRATNGIGGTVEHVTDTEPLFDFTAADGIQHVVWKVPAAEARDLCGAFAAVSALYIADGHHRAASAARARNQLRSRRGAGEWDTFLGVAFPHDEVQILAYNRVVKDLAGASPAALLSRMRERFGVNPGPPVPGRRGDVSMYLDGRWYTIGLRNQASGLRATDRLDVDLLQEQVLSPMLGIKDTRIDKRIDFVGGARGTTFLEEAVSSGRASAAFSLFPVSVDDLMSISDAGGIMPPKSTWFEPKLRDGLLSHVF